MRHISSRLRIVKRTFSNSLSFHVLITWICLFEPRKIVVCKGIDPKMKKQWESVEAVPEATETIATHLEHKPGIAARDVTFQIRWRTVTILVPAHKKKKYIYVTLTAILVTETEPPEGVEPLSWLLLTSLKVETFLQAAQCVIWYRYLWLIERYHFVLKSGC